MLSATHHRIKAYTGSDRSAIVVWTIGIKICTIPLYLIAAKTKRKLNTVQSLLKSMNATVPSHIIRIDKFNQRTTSKTDISKKVKVVREFIYERHGIHNPMRKLFAPLIQMPIWLYASLSLRKMSGMGSYLPNWIDNIIQAPVQMWDLDLSGYWALALYVGMVHSLNCYLFPAPSTRMKYFLAGLSGISIPIAGILPESVVIFWCTSCTWTFFQNLFLESTFMNKYLGPKTFKIQLRNK